MGIINTLFGQRIWYLLNDDTGKMIKGQYEPEELTENIKTKYESINALNRRHPVLQFINGEQESIEFGATLFNRDIAFGSVHDDLETLKEWTRRDQKLGRPPLLTFCVGDGHVNMPYCVIESLGGIQYMRPTLGGKIKGVRLKINLLKYVPYKLESVSGETLYRKSKEGDYYEMICAREYKSPMMGDLIRKRNPDKLIIEPADVIKLPAKENFRKDKVTPKSIPFSGMASRKPTPQRALKAEMLEKRNKPRESWILKG